MKFLNEPHSFCYSDAVRILLNTHHSTAHGNMIQVYWQSWFIIAQADCDKYGIKQMFKRMEIIVEKHSEKHSSKADCEIYG